MDYNYRLDNFISTPSGLDKKIIIYNKRGEFNYSIDPCYISHTYIKNNCLVIKITNKNDIVLSFIDRSTAEEAIIKLDTIRKTFDTICCECSGGTSTTINSGYLILSVCNEEEFLAAFDTIQNNANAGEILIYYSEANGDLPYHSVTLTSDTPWLNHNKIIVKGIGGSIYFDGFKIKIKGESDYTLYNKAIYQNINLIGNCNFSDVFTTEQIFQIDGQSIRSIVFDSVGWSQIVGQKGGQTPTTPIIEMMNNTNDGVSNVITFNNNRIVTPGEPNYYDVCIFGIKLTGELYHLDFVCLDLLGDVASQTMSKVEEDSHESRKIMIYGTQPDYTIGETDVSVISDGTCLVSFDPSWDDTRLVKEQINKYPFIIDRPTTGITSDDYIIFSDTSYGGYLRKVLVSDFVISGETGTSGSSGTSGVDGNFYGSSGTSGLTGSSGTSGRDSADTFQYGPGIRWFYEYNTIPSNSGNLSTNSIYFSGTTVISFNLSSDADMSNVSYFMRQLLCSNLDITTTGTTLLIRHYTDQRNYAIYQYTGLLSDPGSLSDITISVDYKGGTLPTILVPTYTYLPDNSYLVYKI